MKAESAEHWSALCGLEGNRSLWSTLRARCPGLRASPLPGSMVALLLAPFTGLRYVHKPLRM